MTVLPVPPLGENTVTIRPRRAAWPPPPPPPALRPEWPALRIAKTTFSVIWGSRRTSETSASSACSSRAEASPEASRITGACVCSRIAASSSSGKPELRVPWSTTWKWPPVSVAADSRTPSLQPTISISEWRPRASRSSARPSQLPVTKTRTFSRVVTGVSRLMAWEVLSLWNGSMSKPAKLGPGQSVGEHGARPFEPFRAIGSIGRRPEAQRPLAVREDPEELLRLGVGDAPA